MFLVIISLVALAQRFWNKYDFNVVEVLKKEEKDFDIQTLPVYLVFAIPQVFTHLKHFLR